MNNRVTNPFGSLRLSLLLAGLLLACVWLAQPAVAWAQASPDDEEGCGCHSVEKEAWEQSPHAQAAIDESGLPAATCEGCHGPYVRGHPDDGVMALTVDSDVCTECHSGTVGQWENSVHAQSGIQCIGCHLSHSQTLRLSDETLCLSCHRDAVGDNFHLSHHFNDVACTNCHPAPSTAASIAMAAGGETVVTIPAPNHDFVTISGDTCVDCHSKRIGDETVTTTLAPDDLTPVKLLAMADSVPELTAKLNSAEAEKRSLVATSVIALGVGIGVGGVLGMIVVLAVGYVAQRRSTR